VTLTLDFDMPDTPAPTPAATIPAGHEPAVCRCHRTRGGADEGFALDPATGWWVHAACGLPTAGYAAAMAAL
jgi:hypothetical protein